MNRTARHRGPARAGKLRPVAVAIVATALVAALSASFTSAGFRDVARARMAVAAGWASCPHSIDTSGGDLSFQPAGPGASGLIGLCSPNGSWWAYYQDDGNFVIYDVRTFTPTRAAESNGSLSLTLRADGDLVLPLASGWVRHTGTAGVPLPATLAMQDDGNLVLADGTGAVRWTSATAAGVACPPPGATLMCEPKR